MIGELETICQLYKEQRKSKRIRAVCRKPKKPLNRYLNKSAKSRSRLNPPPGERANEWFLQSKPKPEDFFNLVWTYHLILCRIPHGDTIAWVSQRFIYSVADFRGFTGVKGDIAP